MIVYYSGPTEFTHRFVQKLDRPALRLPYNVKEVQELTLDGEYVLFTPTYERRITRGKYAGKMTYIPRQVAALLSSKENRHNLLGVVGFGNRNFHEDYARASDEIHEKTRKPVLFRVELDGTQNDVDIVQKGLDSFVTANTHHSNSTGTQRPTESVEDLGGRD